MIMLRKTKIKSEKISLFAAIFVAVVLGSIFIFMAQKKSDKDTKPSNQSEQNAQQEAQANSENKQQFVEKQSSKGDTPVPTPAAPPSKLELSARQETNNTVTVFTKLFGYSDGECELVVTNGSKTTSQKAAVIYNAEYSICGGFSVPINSVGTGNWSIKLNVTSRGITNTKTISSEVRP